MESVRVVRQKSSRMRNIFLTLCVHWVYSRVYTHHLCQLMIFLGLLWWENRHDKGHNPLLTTVGVFSSSSSREDFSLIAGSTRNSFKADLYLCYAVMISWCSVLEILLLASAWKNALRRRATFINCSHILIIHITNYWLYFLCSSFMMLASIEVHPPQPFNEDCSALKTTNLAASKNLCPGASQAPLPQPVLGQAGRYKRSLVCTRRAGTRTFVHTRRGSSTAGGPVHIDLWSDWQVAFMWYVIVVVNSCHKFLLYVYKASNIFP